jgi:phosphomannomutase
MIASLLVLAILSRENRPLSELIGEIKRYYYSGEINFRTEAKDRIIEEILAEYAGRPEARLTDIDGIRLDFPNWWFNVRKSNTEPYLRLVAEAETAGELDRLIGELKARIRKADPQAEQE